MNRDRYESWLERQRTIPTPDLSDHVMEKISREPSCDGPRLSVGLRWAISVAAIMIGVSRFLYLAALVKLWPF